MSTRIEERFEVRAPAARVWAFLVEPRRVCTCLPGAELTEAVDDRTFDGTVKVKVGPVTVAYRGRVCLEEIDEGARRVRMTGEGRESGGAGSARMRMESRVLETAPGTAEVTVLAEVDVVGRLVQLGRGMIEQVSHQVFLQFAERVRASLEAEAAETAAACPAPAGPVRVLPLLLAALTAWLASLLRRLRGRSSR
jgi:carbon monoxide dehydrogenase subunit G